VIGDRDYPLGRVEGALFCGKVPAGKPYRLKGKGADGATWTHDDAFRFGPVLSDLDEYLLGEGTHQDLWRALGAHVTVHEGTAGTRFAVWAPNARRVSVVGDFNAWDGRRHPMRRRGGTGVWEIFVPGAGEMAVFCSALVGASLGFLWFNAPPAQVFMGDTGSLAFGGSLGVISVIVRHEFVLAIIGGLFVLEAVSVIIQVVSFKTTGKRVFKMAPIHHHFEKLGWKEPTIVIRFWIISCIFALLGLATLKLR
jgi:hypothetical protein